MRSAAFVKADQGREESGTKGNLTGSESGRGLRVTALEPDRECEDEPRETSAEGGQPQRRDARGDAHSCSNPDTRGRREAVHFTSVRHLEDRARAQEADTGDDSLNNAADIAAREAGFASTYYGERSSERDEDVRAKARGGMDTLTLRADQAAEESCREQTAARRREVCGARKSDWKRDVSHALIIGARRPPCVRLNGNRRLVGGRRSSANRVALIY